MKPDYPALPNRRNMVIVRDDKYNNEEYCLPCQYCRYRVVLDEIARYAPLTCVHEDVLASPSTDLTYSSGAQYGDLVQADISPNVLARCKLSSLRKLNSGLRKPTVTWERYPK